MKIRMRFVKTGSMKFIGHLDCMRFFQKAIRRAGLLVAYTEGYSPHQKMSFASPLGVGVTSDGEYLDVEFHALPDMKKKDLIAYLNRFMTEEMFVTDMEIMPEDFKNSMSLLRAADYMLVEKEKGAFPENWRQSWAKFLGQDAITVVKKTKKSQVEMDLKQGILSCAFSLPEFSQLTGEEYGTIHCEYREGQKLYLQLVSGSESNVKPELVLDAFFRYCAVSPVPCQVHRLQMHFAKKRGDSLA